MGGMNDDYFLSYDVQTLLYDSQQANQDKLETIKRLNDKKKLEDLKKRLQNLTTFSAADLKKKMMIEQLEKGTLKKGEYALSETENDEDEEEGQGPQEPSIPEELLQIIKIKTEPNFISFKPLPDPFHDIGRGSKNF